MASRSGRINSTFTRTKHRPFATFAAKCSSDSSARDSNANVIIFKLNEISKRFWGAVFTARDLQVVEDGSRVWRSAPLWKSIIWCLWMRPWMFQAAIIAHYELHCVAGTTENGGRVKWSATGIIPPNPRPAEDRNQWNGICRWSSDATEGKNCNFLSENWREMRRTRNLICQFFVCVASSARNATTGRSQLTAFNRIVALVTDSLRPVMNLFFPIVCLAWRPFNLFIFTGYLLFVLVVEYSAD